jgi:hypothetical protein
MRRANALAPWNKATAKLRGIDPAGTEGRQATHNGGKRDHSAFSHRLFGVAIRHNLTVNDLKTTMFAYPTGASDIEYML